MIASKLNVLAWLGFALSACSGDAGMMPDDSPSLERHMEALESEQLAHAGEVTDAPDLESVDRAEIDDARRMDDHMRQMDRVMGDMMSCAANRGTNLDTEPFARTTQEMRSDRDRHGRVMQDLVSLESARMEELHHQSTMRDRLVTMRGLMSTMMAQASAYRCSPDRHCAM
jgi:hypothetical protein